MTGPGRSTSNSGRVNDVSEEKLRPREIAKARSLLQSFTVSGMSCVVWLSNVVNLSRQRQVCLAKLAVEVVHDGDAHCQILGITVAFFSLEEGQCSGREYRGFGRGVEQRCEGEQRAADGEARARGVGA